MYKSRKPLMGSTISTKEGPESLKRTSLFRPLKDLLLQIENKLFKKPFSESAKAWDVGKVLPFRTWSVIIVYNPQDSFSSFFHPEVQTGKKKQEQIQLEFIECLENFAQYKQLKQKKFILDDFLEFFSFISPFFEFE